ncbi:hypothetical protein FRC17_001999, partial [Serendipita sp. 399]
MEVFITGISPAATLVHVHEALIPILHGPSFAHYHTQERPFNFIVRIFTPKRAGRGRIGGNQGLRNGHLLVPSRAIGEYFLDTVNPFESSSPIAVKVLGQYLKFRAGTHELSVGDLQSLQDMYTDPQALREAMERRTEVSIPMEIRDAEFGWLCHGESISIEASLNSIAPKWTISFEVDDHRVILKSLSGIRVILMINSVRATIEKEKCLLWLDQSPIFDQQRPLAPIPALNPAPEPAVKRKITRALDLDSEVWDYFTSLADDFMISIDHDLPLEEKTRDRVSSPDSSSPIFAYLRTICVSFKHHDQLGIFERNARVARLPIEISAPHDLVKRRLFDTTILTNFRQSLMSLPYDIAFQMEGLLSRSVFNPSELLELKDLVDAALYEFKLEQVVLLTRSLESQRERYPRLAAAELFYGVCEDASLPNIPGKTLGSRRDHGMAASEAFHCHRATVTPTSIILAGPLPDETNRVIRQFYERRSNFLRVEFREEGGQYFRQNEDVDTNAIIDERFGGILRDGLVIGGRKFELLGWSSSALRDHAVWFIHPFEAIKDNQKIIVDGDYIRESLGDFRKVIQYPARYGARIGQAFSATEPTLDIKLHEIIEIGDKESQENPPSVFTDGVSPISPELCTEIWDIMTSKASKRRNRALPPPSTFQVRFGGVKGVLCVCENLRGMRCVAIRPSMTKFESPDSVLEVCKAFDRPMDTFLNRPLIMLLDTLGVPLEPFMNLQQRALDRTFEQSLFSSSAARLLEEFGLGGAFNLPSTLFSFSVAQGDVDILQRIDDQPCAMAPFLQRVIRFAVNHILREIKYKAHIRVPDAWTLVGVADEHDYLQEEEIYACVRKVDGEVIYIEGPVLISRSPTAHPGDARMVRAIGRPPASGSGAGLGLLFNCVVFSCRGKRSLPSMLAGGDLDGDIYSLILDRNLHIRENKPPAESTDGHWYDLGRPSTVEDLGRFVADYIKNDMLGVISTRLLRIADKEPKCMEDPACLILARLHSTAVDFPKTGIPVHINDLPRAPKERPDWESGEIYSKKEKVYPSKRHLGHLYRAVELPAVPEAKRATKHQVHLRRARRGQGETELYANDIQGIFLSTMDQNSVTQTLIWCISTKFSIDELEEDDSFFDIVEEMLAIFEKYQRDLDIVCSSQSVVPSQPLLEEEIVAGSIVASCSQYKFRKANIAAMRRESADLCKMTRDAIKGMHYGEDEQSEKTV